MRVYENKCPACGHIPLNVVSFVAFNVRHVVVNPDGIDLTEMDHADLADIRVACPKCDWIGWLGCIIEDGGG